MKVRISAVQADVMVWAGLGIAGLGIAYLVISYAIPAFTKATKKAATQAAGDVTSGVGDVTQAAISGLDTNTLTQGGPSTGFGGDQNYNYTGFGALSTPAAAANKVSGGLLADIGESLGSWAYDTFGGGSQQ